MSDGAQPTVPVAMSAGPAASQDLARPPASQPMAGAVAIDWGTTNRRGWRLDAHGRTLAFHADDRGMLAARGHFAQALTAMLEALGADGGPAPVLMSGMVGSAQGWVEVPYVPIGLPLSALARHLHPVAFDGRPVHIVPGCVRRAQDAPDGRTDVMRGEETQLLGAVALGHGDGWYLLPGTHSKWVHLRQGAIADFATFMSGELYALLSQQGTLAAAFAADDGLDQPEAFTRGLRDAVGAALSLALFGCRAQVVTGALAAGAARAYLSGLLIGAEWEEIRRRGGGTLPARVTVIGAPALARRHAQAATTFGMVLEIVDAGAASVAGLATLLGSPR